MHTVELLGNHLDTCRDDCAKLGITLPADAFVFSSTPDGTAPPRPASVTTRYRRLTRRLGLRSTRLHALRHYAATELLAHGVDLRTVAGRLGHTDGGTTTLNTYAAWGDPADHHAAETIANRTPHPNPSQKKPRSMYETFAAELRGNITNGTIGPGDELPTVAELAATHHVSAGTAQRALALLQRKSLVQIARGRRATVSHHGATTSEEERH